MRLKALGLLAALAMLAACETPGPERAATTTTTATPPPAAAAPRQASLQEQLVQIGDRIFFDFNKSDLKPEARRQIERWVQFMKQNPNATFTAEGHADERGTREFNLALGERRANAAKNYIVSLGIEARRVATISYGKERPAVLGSNEAAWSQNRRDVLVVN